MNHRITLLLILTFMLPASLFAQDLIVTEAGDSLNCKITQIEEGMLHFTYLRNGSKQKTLIGTNQVKEYRYGYYTASEIPEQMQENGFPQFRIGVSGGWAYMIARISDQVPASERQYIKDLKSGFFLGGDFAYFFPSEYGIGLQESFFKSKSAINDMSVNYIGPAMYQRVVLPDETIVFVSSLSFGLVSYNSQFFNNIVTMTGASLGMDVGVGFDFMLNDHMALCLETSLMFGSFGKMKVKSQGTEEIVELSENENVSRIELGIGLRFYK